MSFTAARASKHIRRACEQCRKRPARFRYHGRVKADRHHTLCFACYRAERERRRARLLTDIPAGPLAAAPAAESRSGALSARQIAHRRRMLACLESAAARRFPHSG